MNQPFRPAAQELGSPTAHPRLPTMAKVGSLATVILVGAQPLVAWKVERAGRAMQVEGELFLHVVPYGLGDRTVWAVAFALVLAIGLATLKTVKRASDVVRRETGRGCWQVVKVALLSVILVDALLTVFVFWLHTVAR